jgi:hypothetical protein
MNLAWITPLGEKARLIYDFGQATPMRHSIIFMESVGTPLSCFVSKTEAYSHCCQHLFRKPGLMLTLTKEPAETGLLSNMPIQTASIFLHPNRWLAQLMQQHFLYVLCRLPFNMLSIFLRRLAVPSPLQLAIQPNAQVVNTTTLNCLMG